METIDILKQAKQELINRGRTTRTLINGSTGKVCPLGAIGLAADPVFQLRLGYDIFREDEAGYEAAQALAEAIPDSVFEEAKLDREGEYDDVVYEYNDEIVGPGESGDQEVLYLFDRAIAGLEGAA